MTSTRDVILARIRGALGRELRDSPPEVRLEEGSPGPGILRKYRRSGGRTQEELLDLLHDRIADYKATVVRCPGPKLSGVLGERLAARGASRVVAPPDLPDTWMGAASPPGLDLLRDNAPGELSNNEISSAHAVITGCALAVAETGTLVLDGGAAQGRRALTLLPDYHLCVVFASQVVETVPEAMEAFEPFGKDRTAPLTLISGPSATSDIELIRVEGVHGPRTLDVILVED